VQNATWWCSSEGTQFLKKGCRMDWNTHTHTLPNENWSRNCTYFSHSLQKINIEVEFSRHLTGLKTLCITLLLDNIAQEKFVHCKNESKAKISSERSSQRKSKFCKVDDEVYSRPWLGFDRRIYTATRKYLSGSASCLRDLKMRLRPILLHYRLTHTTTTATRDFRIFLFN